MLLRHLLSQVVRQQAESQLREAWQRQQQTAEPTEEAELPPASIGVFFASPAEAGGLLDQLPESRFMRCARFDEYRAELHGHSLAVGVQRDPQEPSAEVVSDLLQLAQPQWLIAAGFAAALEPDLPRGTKLLATEIVSTQGMQLHTGIQVDPEQLEKQFGVRAGRVLSADRLLRSASQKKELAATTQALVADLESYAAAELCRAARVRFLSVRIVSETLEDELSDELEQFQRQETWAGKLGATAGALWRRPGVVKEWWALQERGVTASDELAKFVAKVIRQLPESRTDALSRVR